jgi:hypothetical protein
MAETSNKINKMRGAFKALPVVFGSTVIDQMDYTSAANLGLFRERASTLKGLDMWFPLTYNKQFYTEHTWTPSLWGYMGLKEEDFVGLAHEHGLWRKNSKGRPGWSDVLMKWEVGPIDKEKQLVFHGHVDVGDEDRSSCG